ncbi:IS5 family transposase [Streptomyces sp. TRM66268-LWL]|uniref:IS5 family transposase n=1 Tax=Streptomyces polyasparticus TaxID=2767826 RepID=A0ABR7SW80_9ACTN|nr:IS5 family transposase [Streptomyces polyasparticus]MBC9719779.1 IS5 family transposase [Streptomyces polyasparticus]
MSLTDAQWARIEPLLPDRAPKRGGRWRDHRQVIDAIAWKYRTGSPWMDLPEEFGSWKGAHNRLRMWALDGTWQRIFTALLAQADAAGDLDWVVAVDSTIVRAHQHAAGARQKGPRSASRHHALGRSRGGLTTKIHLAADGHCRPLSFVLTPGQAGDAPAFTQVMAQLRVPRKTGRPRTTPDAVLADKAYSSRAIRELLRKRGIRTVIPQPADQITKRKKRGRIGGRPPAFDRESYRQRNTVERCINRLKQWRGLATRYDKTATIYLAGLHIAAIFIWSAT